MSSILTIGSNIRPRNRDDYADFSFPVRVLPFTLPFTDYKLFSLSLTVPVPTLDLGMRPGRVQDLTGGRTPFLCLSFSIKN